MGKSSEIDVNSSFSPIKVAFNAGKSNSHSPKSTSLRDL